MGQFFLTAKFFRLSIISAFLLSASGSGYASAFQVWDQSAYGLGDNHASAGSEGDDASLEFYNPAQITELKHQQVSTGGVLIPVNIKFNGTVDGLNANGKSDHVNAIPNFHYVAPFNNRLYFAFGLTTPFGLQTDYGTDNEIMAAAATKTQLLTTNANPSFAYKIRDWVSVAAGFDLMYGIAAYNSVPSPGDSFKNRLDGWGAGYNAGIFFKFRLFNLPYETQLGASYRSAITVKASGKSHFQTSDTDVKAQLPLPATTLFSIYQPVSPRVAVMGSVFYTQWDTFTLLQLENTAINNGTDIPVYEAYIDTWNTALGLHVKVTDTVTWKVGGGFDETPTRTGYRDVRLPDVNRFAVTTGLHWQMRKQLGLELGYAHLMTPHANVDNSTSAQGSGDIIPDQEGTATMSANVFGAQLSWTFE